MYSIQNLLLSFYLILSCIEFTINFSHFQFDTQVSDDCYHVLAKDCSGRQPVAVMVKDITAQQKEVILLLGGQTKIELTQNQQRNGLYGKAKLQVKINDQRAESLPRVIRAKDTGKLIAKIELMNEGSIQVISPQFQVATNGKYIVVFAANSLRNRTCGVCGNFDGEKVSVTYIHSTSFNNVTISHIFIQLHLYF